MSTPPNEPQDPRPEVSGQPTSGEPRPAEPHAVDAPAAPGQQYGQAGGKYGTAEYNPGQYTGAVERPSLLDRLLRLTMISLGVYVLSGTVGLIAVNSIDFHQLYRDMGLSTEMADQAAASQTSGLSSTLGSIVSLVIGIALYVLVWSNLKKGKNWARILGTVFAAISIVGGLFGLFGSFIYPAPWNIIMILLVVVKIVVDIIWIVTAFKAPNTAWFKQNQVQR